MEQERRRDRRSGEFFVKLPPEEMYRYVPALVVEPTVGRLFLWGSGSNGINALVSICPSTFASRHSASSFVNHSHPDCGVQC